MATGLPVLLKIFQLRLITEKILRAITISFLSIKWSNKFVYKIHFVSRSLFKISYETFFYLFQMSYMMDRAGELKDFIWRLVFNVILIVNNIVILSFEILKLFLVQMGRHDWNNWTDGWRRRTLAAGSVQTHWYNLDQLAIWPAIVGYYILSSNTCLLLASFGSNGSSWCDKDWIRSQVSQYGPQLNWYSSWFWFQESLKHK